MRKANELEHFLKETEVDVMSISESRHTTNRKPPDINDYHTIYHTRDENQSGVVMYVRNNIPYIPIDIKTQTMESITAIIEGIQITGIYNMPANKISIEDLNKIFEADQIIAIKTGTRKTNYGSVTITTKRGHSLRLLQKIMVWTL